jgi:hypothetical protein
MAYHILSKNTNFEGSRRGIPFRNGTTFVKDALLAQMFKNDGFDVIVIKDDGSLELFTGQVPTVKKASKPRAKKGETK